MCFGLFCAVSIAFARLMMMAASLLLSLLLLAVVLVSTSNAVKCYECAFNNSKCADYDFDPDDKDVGECEGLWCIKFRAESSAVYCEYKHLHVQCRSLGVEEGQYGHSGSRPWPLTE